MNETVTEQGDKEPAVPFCQEASHDDTEKTLLASRSPQCQHKLYRAGG